MKAITVPLDEWQMDIIQPAADELNEAAKAGKPGMMLAQVHKGGMRVFVLDNEKAMKFAGLLNVNVSLTGKP